MLRFALVVALAASALVSQAVISHSNYDTFTYADNQSMGGPNLLLAVKTTIPTAFVASRIEWFTGERAGLNTVSLWSHDAANNRPLAQLAGGSWQMGWTNSWQGAPLTTPLQLNANDVVWVVWGPQNGAQSSVQGTSGSMQQYRGSFDGGATWTGPFQGVQWKFRIWSGPAGHYESFGAGCSGTAGIPRLSWFGLPMVGTSWNVQIARAPGSGVALLAIGDSDAVASGLPLPLNLAALGAPACNLLTSFPVTVATPTDVTGEAVLTLSLPANPAIIGFQLFNQWFVLDPPANAFGFTVSNGGKATVGG
jgi:hypothetical protein